jgi:hypothetical protein
MPKSEAALYWLTGCRRWITTRSMPVSDGKIEVITSVQRRRRWSAEEKARIVQETYAPSLSVLLVVRQNGTVLLAATLCRGALSAIGAGEEVVPKVYEGLQSLGRVRCPRTRRLVQPSPPSRANRQYAAS